MQLRIKICGITSLDDALAVADAGADALGLNFFASSKRYIAPQRAAHLCHALPPGLLRVGVFVNAPPAEVAQISRELGLHAVQLHGDEPPEQLAQVVHHLGRLDLHADMAALRPMNTSTPDPADSPAAQRPLVIRALRTTAAGLAPIDHYLQRCRRLQCLPDYLLLDAQQDGAYGGTGQVADWNVAAAYVQRAVRDAAHEIAHTAPAQRWPLLILAGGLTPDNVAQAIRAVRPAAVDTASGVESAPGRKDAQLVRAFVQRARQALRGL
jgi:phosphoribosylanthranilate isomerase